MIKNQWYAILPSKKVSKNQIVAVKRLNLELALFRNSFGELGCVVDQCTHRGSALSLGKVKGDCIQCPFHGLEFDKDGACKFIPANGKSSTIDLNRYHVKQYPVREEYGIIYLWYGDGDPESQVLPFFHQDVDASYSYSEIEDHWHSHYSRSIENQLDVVHLPFIHHNTIGRGNKTLVNGPKVLWADGILTTCANNEVDHGQKPKSQEDFVIADTYLSFMFPNIWMNHISEKLKVIIFFAPVDDENTILFIRLYTRQTRFKSINNIIAYFGRFGNRIIELQDKRVVITQKPKASSLSSSEQLIAGDAPIIKYRRIRQELKDNSLK